MDVRINEIIASQHRYLNYSHVFTLLKVFMLSKNAIGGALNKLLTSTEGKQYLLCFNKHNFHDIDQFSRNCYIKIYFFYAVELFSLIS